MKLSPVWQLTRARLRELRREPGTLFWAFGFPVLLTVGLGLAFQSPSVAPAVGVREGAPPALVETLRAAHFVVEPLDAATGRERLRSGRVAVVVATELASGKDVPAAGPGTGATAGAGLIFSFDPHRPESRAVRDAVEGVLQRAAGRRDPLTTRDRLVIDPGARYVDFLVPGLVGMNVMSGSLWAIGWAIVNLRVRGLTKRLLATPVARADLLASLAVARLVVLPFEMASLLVFARVAFAIPIHGSLALVALVCVVGCLSFSGVAILVASRAQNVETVTGLINAVVIPMFVVSGVFFPSSRFPAHLQPVIALLPLTTLNDALRRVMLDGAGLASLGRSFAILAAWGAITFALGLRRFRWT
jgi:ABC-2 type transport system permease protein